MKFEFSEGSPLERISPEAPKRPINIPITCVFSGFDLNRNRPTTKEKIGTNEFSIPVKELETSVCANVNKKAGIPLPITPVKIKYFQSLALTLLKPFKANGNKTIEAKLILNAATTL
jgi:hypothetical protein